ncbi:hypothetical protein GCM10009780_60650 [Actinomadura alba]
MAVQHCRPRPTDGRPLPTIQPALARSIAPSPSPIRSSFSASKTNPAVSSSRIRTFCDTLPEICLARQPNPPTRHPDRFPGHPLLPRPTPPHEHFRSLKGASLQLRREDIFVQRPLPSDPLPPDQGEPRIPAVPPKVRPDLGPDGPHQLTHRKRTPTPLPTGIPEKKFT